MNAIALKARGLVNRRSYLERSNSVEARSFLKLVFVNRSVGEIALAGDMTKGGAKNLKGGRHGIRFENLIAMCRNDKAFLDALTALCECGHPENGLNAAVNAFLRRDSTQQPP